MPKQIIQNNNGGVVSIQLPGPKRDAKSRDQTVQLGKVVDLGPGITMIDAADWDKAKENPIVVAMLKEKVPQSRAPEQDQNLVGRFRLVDCGQAADENPLGKMRTPEALKLVEETLDTNTLEKWLETENRAELRKAMQNQIKEINAPLLGTGGASPTSGELGDHGQEG